MANLQKLNPTQQELCNYLEQQTGQVNFEVLQPFTTQEMGAVLHISRNTVSQYLNEFFKEGWMVKINTRPVYYFLRETLSRKFNVQTLAVWRWSIRPPACRWCWRAKKAPASVCWPARPGSMQRKSRSCRQRAVLPSWTAPCGAQQSRAAPALPLRSNAGWCADGAALAQEQCAGAGRASAAAQPVAAGEKAAHLSFSDAGGAAHRPQGAGDGSGIPDADAVSV